MSIGKSFRNDGQHVPQFVTKTGTYDPRHASLYLAYPTDLRALGIHGG